MTIRELIEELQDIERRCGRSLLVDVCVDASYEDDDESGLYISTARVAVKDVVYQGGGAVELRT